MHMSDEARSDFVILDGTPGTPMCAWCALSSTAISISVLSVEEVF